MAAGQPSLLFFGGLDSLDLDSMRAFPALFSPRRHHHHLRMNLLFSFCFSVLLYLESGLCCFSLWTLSRPSWQGASPGPGPALRHLVPKAPPLSAAPHMVTCQTFQCFSHFHCCLCSLLWRYSCYRGLTAISSLSLPAYILGFLGILGHLIGLWTSSVGGLFCSPVALSL